jgi:lysozyme
MNAFDMAAMIAQLIPEEAERYMVYDDATGQPIRRGSVVKGNPTIGIGRELSMTGLTDSECRMLCENDITAVAAAFDLAIPWWRELSPVRQMQLVDLAFNMGVHGLLTGWPHFLADMKAGNWGAACTELESSTWWHQVGERGPAIAGRILAG